MSDKAETAERADHKTRFSANRQPVKNGRPRESRDRLTSKFLAALADDFQKHGKAVIETVRKDEPATYLKVVAAIVPKEVEIVRPLDGVTDDELAQIIDTIRAQIPDDDKPTAPLN